MKFWIMTSETVVDTCDTMAFIGLYSTAEKAKEYLARWYLKTETFAEIEWEQSEHNPGFWEGHDAGHEHCFLITQHDWDELDHGVK